ncbi:MAG: AI-2E family transporter [Desulfovibrio sp.]|jgi:predicted PurR-regulated permease PerM|nr:AI-2E family transporter [Desulfovibrio sp.]
MNSVSPRVFYLLAALAWGMLLWRHPTVIFTSACLACLALPLYRRLRRKCRHWSKGPRPGSADTLSPKARTVGAGKISLLRQLPIWAYTLTLIAAMATPLAALILLVAPQFSSGLARLRELQANNFQIPDDWLIPIRQWQSHLAEYPRVEKSFNDFFQHVNRLLDDASNMLLSWSFDLLGGTMTVLWTFFLFITLTVLFTLYSRRIRVIAGRIFALPQSQLRRFVAAIRRALRAVMLGIALVAVIQGFLCGIGFAVAGFHNAAFWGTLATLTAPIPMVGTAIVWLPLSLSLWFTGKTFAAVGLTLWGILAVSMVDNLLRPLFLRHGIKTSFLVLITVILCGLNAFGAVGLIAGPVLLAFAIQAVEESNRFYLKK